MVDFEPDASYVVHKTDVLKNYLDYTDSHGETIQNITLITNDLDRGWSIECVSKSGEEVMDIISPTIFDQLIKDGVLEEM